MIYLPTLHTFAMNNIFTGSSGQLRFKLTPKVVMAPGGKEVEFDNSSILGELWHGDYCYEKSEIEQTRQFPMSEPGRSDMQRWLEAATNFEPEP